ncbi:hypothetical protein HK100_004301 [Physocladia obscura]|uniref:Uncharacterized protein n=1 Tax=Physocladia obscura TaxID=109957 RepID=A0AAD5T782_9FUNG|nr:hypothetical protein HK100_004301 [Physocladia obscura]
MKKQELSVDATNNARGRHLLANANLRRGTVIVREEAAACIATTATPDLLACFACLQTKAKSTCKRCATCRITVYCSSGCATRDWRIHKLECRPLLSLSVLPQINSDGNDSTKNAAEANPMLLLRLLLRLLISVSLNLCRASDILNLAGDKAAFPPQILKVYAQIVIAVKSCTAPVAPAASITSSSTSQSLSIIPAEFDSAATLISILCKISCNAITVLDQSAFKECGVAIYPRRISLANHSCEPNCTIVFDAPTNSAKLVAITDIAAGQELVISYLDAPAQLVETRRAELLQRYHFECRCNLCLRQIPFSNLYNCLETKQCIGVTAVIGRSITGNDTEKCSKCTRAPTDALQSRLAILNKNEKMEQNQENHLGRIISIISEIFPPETRDSHLILPLQSLYDASLAIGDWLAAHNHCLALIDCMTRIYKPYSPVLGLQYLSACRLATLVIDDGGRTGIVDGKIVMRNTASAVDILETILGRDNVLAKEANEKRAQLSFLTGPATLAFEAKRAKTTDGAKPSVAAQTAVAQVSGIPDKDKIAALIAEKRKEIAAKMAAMTKTAGASPATPVVTVPIPAVTTVPPVLSDVQRRMLEVQARISATMRSSNIPQTISDPAKRGLKMDVHPLFDKSGAVDVDSIRTMFPKTNFSTVKANQRTSTATTSTATAAAKEAARLALAAIKKKEALENPDAAKEADNEPAQKKQLELVEPSPDFFDPHKNPYFDTKIAAKASMPKQRMAHKSFKFVQQGKFVDMANRMRQQAMLEKLKADIAANVKKSGMAVELDLVSDLCVRREPPPAIEWWDTPLLGPDMPYDSFNLDSPQSETILTNLIQRPVPIQPPAELGPPPPKPLMLTKQERKKLRRQRRLEQQKEKQDKIRIGLLPPDQPKVKISNLMRVLGTEAVQDPTKIEAAVRQQMRARQLKHDKYIAENKLTKEQKRERTRLKLIENTHVIVEAAVFKVTDLSRPQNRFKVDVNAQQLFLSGVALLHNGNNLVVVEGGNRGIKQYKKLMLRRIDWTETDNDDEEDENEETPARDAEKLNECILIWEGKIKRRLFNGFSVIQCATERDIKEALEKANAIHYWDTAKHFSSDKL